MSATLNQFYQILHISTNVEM